MVTYCTVYTPPSLQQSCELLLLAGGAVAEDLTATVLAEMGLVLWELLVLSMGGTSGSMRSELCTHATHEF